MIRTYAVMGKDLHVIDTVSQDALRDLSGKADLLWMDCFNLDDEETMIISELQEVDMRVMCDIKNGKIQPSYEKCRDYSLVSIPSVNFTKELKLYPISIIVKESVLITLRNERHSGFIEPIIETIKDCAVEGKEVGLSFIVSRLFRGIVDGNSEAMVSFRELIDRIKKEALEKPWRKTVTRSIFKLKKWVSSLHRLLWVEKELMFDMKEGVVPHVKLTNEAKMIVDDAIDDINRELEFIDSYNRSLDSILRLQDLGLIHRVERTLVYLTIIILLMNILLIILSLMK